MTEARSIPNSAGKVEMQCNKRIVKRSAMDNPNISKLRRENSSYTDEIFFVSMDRSFSKYSWSSIIILS